MELVDYRSVQCPYCGEDIEVAIDATAGEQAYVEDCSVCCRPIEMRVLACDGGLAVEARRDDD